MLMLLACVLHRQERVNVLHGQERNSVRRGESSKDEQLAFLLWRASKHERKDQKTCFYTMNLSKL